MQKRKSKGLIEILLVEDNLDDAEFAQLALQEARVMNQLHHVLNGEAAIAFLQDPSKLRPDLILLDLNMPKMNGWEVLQVIKHNESLQEIPVIVLTTPGLEADIPQTYPNQVNHYLSKPVDFDKLAQAIIQLPGFGFQVVELPSTQV